ncbi:MAG TPA: hypothetical protein VIY48_19260 [Candidatus Paceibacterota bacterium]
MFITVATLVALVILTACNSKAHRDNHHHTTTVVVVPNQAPKPGKTVYVKPNKPSINKPSMKKVK